MKRKECVHSGSNSGAEVKSVSLLGHTENFAGLVEETPLDYLRVKKEDGAGS